MICFDVSIVGFECNDTREFSSKGIFQQYSGVTFDYFNPILLLFFLVNNMVNVSVDRLVPGVWLIL